MKKFQDLNQKVLCISKTLPVGATLKATKVLIFQANSEKIFKNLAIIILIEF